MTFCLCISALGAYDGGVTSASAGIRVHHGQRKLTRASGCAHDHDTDPCSSQLLVSMHFCSISLNEK